MKAPTKAVMYVATSCLAVTVVVHSQDQRQRPQGPAEAPAGFDNQTNGMIAQPAFETARQIFEERDTIAEGLGPMYNAQSCAECHQNPVTGATSQITELRVGHYDPRADQFIAPPGGSLIHSRAIDASLEEQVQPGNEVRTFRTSGNTLGEGFVEAIDDFTFHAIQANQPQGMQGQIVIAPVLEAPGKSRVGRFGWKDQHASLRSFSADAYLNEIGITTALMPNENGSNGRPVTEFDPVPDPEDHDDDVSAFAAFIRASKAPPRDVVLAATPDAQAGAALFAQIGCATCHVASITTAPTGTSYAGGTFVVPAALGNKVIHPYSDFLLHDIGTGDGIVQNGDQSTRNKMRTAPLWGLRTHNRFMHDGESLTLTSAILRHDGEASHVISRYRNLPDQLRMQVLTFLLSL
jgi:CxxC motif-containing protein (DUF1111 family)